jgi:hypothetical protein
MSMYIFTPHSGLATLGKNRVWHDFSFSWLNYEVKGKSETSKELASILMFLSPSSCVPLSFAKQTCCYMIWKKNNKLNFKPYIGISGIWELLVSEYYSIYVFRVCVFRAFLPVTLFQFTWRKTGTIKLLLCQD